MNENITNTVTELLSQIDREAERLRTGDVNGRREAIAALGSLRSAGRKVLRAAEIIEQANE